MATEIRKMMIFCFEGLPHFQRAHIPSVCGVKSTRNESPGEGDPQSYLRPQDLYDDLCSLEKERRRGDIARWTQSTLQTVTRKVDQIIFLVFECILFFGILRDLISSDFFTSVCPICHTTLHVPQFLLGSSIPGSLCEPNRCI